MGAAGFELFSTSVLGVVVDFSFLVQSLYVPGFSTLAMMKGPSQGDELVESLVVLS
jgi:hypothetical protein